MALILKDRVKQLSTTTGTGTITLSTGFAGYQTFASAVSDGDEVYYTINSTQTGVTEWEVGVGTFTLSGTTLSRDTVLSSSNSDTLVDFSAGDKEVFITYPASKSVNINKTGDVAITQSIAFTPVTHQTHAEGKLYYDTTHRTLNYQNDISGIDFELGNNEYIRVYNNTGVTINKGKPVTFSGIYTQIPTVVLCNATSETTYQVDGLVTADIANASYGYITISGVIRGFDTSGLTAGKRTFVGLTDGALTNTAPSYPNYPMCVGYTLYSDASDGELVVIPQNHTVPNFRVKNNVYIGNDTIIDGDLTVNGSQIIASSTNIETGAPFFYLSAGDTIGQANTTFTGSGLDNGYYTGHFTGTASTSYYVKIDGTGTPDTFAWSKDDFATTEASGVAITGENLLDNGISIYFATTTGHTLNDKWSGTAAPSNVDTGLWSNRNTGGTGVGYTHIGVWFDVTDEKWKFTNAYAPEPTGSINTGDASYVGGTVSATTFEGALTGNASTASAWATGRTLSLTGDVTGTSASFDGSGNISVATTIAANSVALGTDTTGNYVASITNGSYITGGDGGSEGAGLTLAVDATDANTASKVVARDASGNFSAGTITATINGTVTNGVVTTGSYADPSWIISLDDGKVLPSMTGNSGKYLTTDGTNSSWGTISSANDGTLSMSVSGVGLSGSATFTANQAGASSFTVTSNATNANTASTIVARDASGNFSAGTITASLSGNATTVTNGVYTTDIGSTVQAYDAGLADIAGLAVTDGNFIVGDGANWVAESGATVRTSLGLGSLATLSTISNDNWSGTDLAVANGGTGASDAATARTNLGLAIGTNVQAYDADLTTIAGLSSADGNFIVGSATGWVAESGATARTSLGLGTAATSATGDFATAAQGTTADSALQPGDIGSTVQAYDAELTAIAALAVTDSNFIVGNGTTWVAETGATARTSIGLGTANNVQFNSLGVGTAGSGTAGEIRATNNVTAYYSDERLKTIKGNIENALDKVASLNGFHYEANEVANKLGYESKPEIGVSAQEVQKILPEIVVPAPIDENYLTVHYEKLAPLFVEAIKELKGQVETLQAEINELKNRGN